jgi:hypothetical protein
MAAYQYHVEPADPTNTHHLLLRKGADQVGIILCDATGKRDPKNIQRQSYPRSAIKFYQGEEDYGDSEPPFRPIAQSDFSGGRGLLTFETDTRRFQDSYRTDTRHAGKVFNGPLETYTTGDHRKIMQWMPGPTLGVGWQALYGSVLYYARSSTAPSGGMSAYYASAILKAVGTPPDVRLEVWTNVAGSPGALIANAYVSVTAASMNDNPVSETVVRLLVTPPSLVTVTTYWFVLRATGTPDADNHWEAGYDTTPTPGKSSANGTDWSITTGPYFRLTPANITLRGKSFDYKGARYLVTRPDSGNSMLYIEGDRGTADSNAGQLTKLIDATKAGWSASFPGAGAVIQIVKGPGSEEAQPWRITTGSGAGECTVNTPWITEHTTETEYVVLNTGVWDVLADLGGQVTDFVATDEFIYFARGETAGLNVLRYQAYNSGGVWNPGRTEAEDEPALYLTATRDPSTGTILWGARNDHPLFGVCVWKGHVPPAWGKLYTVITELAPTDEPWDLTTVTNVTQSTEDGATKIDIAAGFTTGGVAIEELAQEVDITRGKKLGVLAYSSVATDGDDLSLRYDDCVNKAYSPTGLQHYTGTYASLDASKDGDTGTDTTPSFTTTSRLYIGFTERFGKITVTLGATKNANASVLTLKIFNGSLWTTSGFTMTDGTQNPAGTTFGQSGDITFNPKEADWEQCTVNNITAYWVRLEFSANLTASINLQEVSVTRANQTTVNLPAHVAGEWQWDVMAISPLQFPLPDATALRYIWLYVNTDLGAQVVKLFGGVQVLADEITHIKLPNDARINGMWAYAGSETTPRRYPWVWTEKEFGEIQASDSVDLYVPVALDELAALRSELNGRAHAVHNRYLWFNLGERIERYQNEQLEDVGPTLDEGLPANRRGNCVKLLSYPGQMLAAYDAGSSGYSSVLSYTGGGWHEVYRAPKGERIWDIDTQSIPGKVDRLWVTQGDDILWLPIDLNPLTNSDYCYTCESVIYSCRVWGGMQDVLKFWKSLKLVSQSLASGQAVWGDFKIEGEASWHQLPAVFDTSMFQEVLLDYGYDRSGRYIELRLRAQTNDATKTPVILGWVIESLMRFEVKFVWSINFRLANKDNDLRGNPDPLGYAEKLALLDAWLLSPTPLEVSCFREEAHGAIAFLEPVPLRPLRTAIDPEYPEESRLVDICQLTLIGI